MITVLDTWGPLEKMGLEALEEEEEEEEEKDEEEEEGEESMMDGTGKHFSSNGCANKPRIYAVPGQPQRGE